MVDLSLVMPLRDAAQDLPARLAEIRQTLDGLDQSYELILVDDASGPSTVACLQHLLQTEPDLRVLRLDRPAGLSAALTAGIEAARGATVLALEAGRRVSPDAIPALIHHLSRADLVCGRPRRRGLAKAWHRLARIPRWLLLGLEVRDPEVLTWAARKEAVAGLQLPRGMYRYLATLVALRGYRVGEVPVCVAPGRGGLGDGWPNPGDLLAAWWLTRRWRHCTAEELGAGDRGRPRIRIASFDAGDESDPSWSAGREERDTGDRRAG